jgi:hypothetical protein
MKIFECHEQVSQTKLTDRVRRGKWAHKNEVLTFTASISFDFGDIKKFVVQML